jgi:transcriptional regulator with XRE-family HTH domain
LDDQHVFRVIGLRIVELRRAKGVTQEKLAETIGLDARDLRRLEAGANATVSTLNGIARALGVPLATIFEMPVNLNLRRPGRPAAQRSLPVAAETVKHGRKRSS